MRSFYIQLWRVDMHNQMTIISKIMGILMMGFSLTFLIPIVISFIYADHQYGNFLISFFVTLLIGALLWFPNRNTESELKTRNGFIIVTLFWAGLSIVCAIPFYFSDVLNIGFIRSLFEATSGFSTTGSTTLRNLEMLPKSILWYRTQLQFLGGMGVIILAVAIMPLLGMGGMTLFKAEIPGPMKEEKLTPRIAQTARNLWIVYITLLVVCICAYYFAGMSFFDAITHAFSTVSTAGFTNYDDGLAHFNSGLINSIAVFFMFLGGINFTLHYLAFRDRKLTRYFNNYELKVYVYICIVAVLITMVTLKLYGTFSSWLDAFSNAIFAVVAMITTTGFTIAPMGDWPVYLPLFLIFLSFIGGCTGSTAGGIKVIRVLLLIKQAGREVYRLIHPRAQISVRIDGKVIPESILGSILAFLGLYGFSLIILTLVMIGTGLSPLASFTAIAGCLNITGTALGAVSSNYASVNEFGLSVLTFAMILGRLEIFTIFVLLTPAFWRD